MELCPGGSHQEGFCPEGLCPITGLSVIYYGPLTMDAIAIYETNHNYGLQSFKDSYS